MHNFHYHRFINTGVKKKKRQAFPVWRDVQKVRSDTSSTVGTNNISPPSERVSGSRPPTRPIRVHQGRSVQAEPKQTREFHPMTAAEWGSVQPMGEALPQLLQVSAH